MTEVQRGGTWSRAAPDQAGAGQVSVPRRHTGLSRPILKSLKLNKIF